MHYVVGISQKKKMFLVAPPLLLTYVIGCGSVIWYESLHWNWYHGPQVMWITQYPLQYGSRYLGMVWVQGLEALIVHTLYSDLYSMHMVVRIGSETLGWTLLCHHTDWSKNCFTGLPKSQKAPSVAALDSSPSRLLSEPQNQNGLIVYRCLSWINLDKCKTILRSSRSFLWSLPGPWGSHFCICSFFGCI